MAFKIQVPVLLLVVAMLLTSQAQCEFQANMVIDNQSSFTIGVSRPHALPHDGDSCWCWACCDSSEFELSLLALIAAYTKVTYKGFVSESIFLCNNERKRYQSVEIAYTNANNERKLLTLVFLIVYLDGPYISTVYDYSKYRGDDLNKRIDTFLELEMSAGEMYYSRLEQSRRCEVDSFSEFKSKCLKDGLKIVLKENNGELEWKYEPSYQASG
eukprot:Nk52_evm1s184 gene=Nk52_evmTU1s184